MCKELFNKKVAKITFIVLFLFPAFHGHMSFNSKDTIIAFCHVWIFYSFIKYLKNQSKIKVLNIFIILEFYLQLVQELIYFFLVH